MEVKDLRIGNLVKFKDGKYRRISMIDGLSNGVIALERIGLCDIEDCEPIPLTEEWLLKFDFSKLKETAKGLAIYNVWSKGNFVLTSWGTEGDSANMLNLSFNGHSLDIFPNNVHDLQNLYFVLKGEELTIKEQVT